MKLDFSDVKERPVLTEGKHTLLITGAKEARSANGTDGLSLDFEGENKEFVRDFVCTEGVGAFRAQQLIKALGVSEEDFANMEAADLVGLSVNAQIVIEDYNGESRAKVKSYLAA